MMFVAVYPIAPIKADGRKLTKGCNDFVWARVANLSSSMMKRISLVPGAIAQCFARHGIAPMFTGLTGRYGVSLIRWGVVAAV